ncbi:MAG TPA: glycoside hydrolase family 97 catalytic domain-containing protein, partial [Bacteroidota bacterium]
MKSPDGGLAVVFETLTDGKPSPTSGQLVYSVTFRGKRLVARSALSLGLEGQRPLGSSVRIVRSADSRTDETYKPLWGKSASVRNHFNALSVELAEPEGLKRNLMIEARAYDDAVAFRYVVPEQPSLSELRLANEKTEFRISKDAATYALVLPNERSMYESEFLRLPISGFANQGGVASKVLIGLPLLMDVPGVAWMAITEAHVQDYPAMYLVNPSGSWEGHWFESRLAARYDNPELAAVGTLPHSSAWRVILVAAEPGRLIESNVVQNLNPKSALKNVSWIRPGKSSWDWWSGSIGPDGKGAFNTATMKHFVDFSAIAGLEYMLIDAGWSKDGDITSMNGTVDVPEVVRYAAKKNVKVWIWLHWLPVEKQMNEAFPLYEKWGVAGVKIDFMSRDDQAMMNFYYRVAEKASKHRLMVDFHGSTKPTGLERTFPNVVGYEAVLGMEQSKAGARDNPENRLMIPFTRMLAGLVDYTPGGFRNVTREEFEPRFERPVVMGTRAHHLAMYVVYQVPFQMVSD